MSVRFRPTVLTVFRRIGMAACRAGIDSPIHWTIPALPKRDGWLAICKVDRSPRFGDVGATARILTNVTR